MENPELEEEIIESDEEVLDENTDRYDAYEYIKGRTNLPPLVHEKSQIISAVVNSNLEELRQLLPTRRDIKDRYGYNLLQIAICYQESAPIFEYLLELGYDIDARDPQGDTSLFVALSAYIYGSNEPIYGDYYAYRLVEQGANMNSKNRNYDMYTPLHHACDRGFYNTCALLISKGADIHMADNDGMTPLHVLLVSKRVKNWIRYELVCMFMMYKARITEKEFDLSMRGQAYEVQEMLYKIICSDGDFKEYWIPAQSVKGILPSTSQLFYEMILTQQIELDIEDCDSDVYSDSNILLFAQPLFLEWFINNFPEGARSILERTEINFPDKEIFDRRICDNLGLMFEKQELVKSIHDFFWQDFFHRKTLVNYLTSTRRLYKISEEDLTQLVLTLVSYGVDFYECDLESVHFSYGFCFLFETLLQIELKKNEDHFRALRHIVPRFIYDIHMTVEDLWRDLAAYHRRSVPFLLGYFRSNLLSDFCLSLNIPQVTARVMKIECMVPSLEQLARDVFRRHVVTHFQPNSTAEYYTLIKYILPTEIYNVVSLKHRLYR